MEATHVFVAQTLFGADENFPERPVLHGSGVVEKVGRGGKVKREVRRER
jgi:hypothetical protein